MPKVAKSEEKEKKASPKITVETVTDYVPATEVKETKPSVLDPVPEPSSTSTPTTKIGSFSQLDADKMKTLDELDKKAKMEDAQPFSETKTNEVSEKSVSSDEIKEWLKEVKPDTTKEMEGENGKGGKYIIFIVLILLLIGVVGGGLYYFNSRVGTTTVVENQEPVSEIKPTESPTPTPEVVDLSKLKVNLLNGNGLAGEAGRVKITLEDLGFKEFTTGNAKNYNYASTEVSLKKGLNGEVYTKIKESLTKNYVVEKTETELSESSSYDVVIIIGAKKS